jgi:hypothetical protein
VRRGLFHANTSIGGFWSREKSTKAPNNEPIFRGGLTAAADEPRMLPSVFGLPGGSFALPCLELS